MGSMNRDSDITKNLERALDAFRGCGWEAVVEGVVRQDYPTMSLALCRAAGEAKRDGNESRGKVLRLLADVCSMNFSPEERNEPFRVQWLGNGKRTVVPDDFSESEITFFAKIIDIIDVPLLRGRLADLVWIRQKPRDVKFARAVIDSYMEIPLKIDAWLVEGEPCWHRAITLSRMLGQGSEDRLNVIESSIVGAIESSTREDGYFPRRLSAVLESNGLGDKDAITIAVKLESLACEYEKGGSFLQAQDFYYTSATWFRQAGDDDKALEMTVAQAENVVKEAEARISSDGPRYGEAASFYEEAIQVYRTIPRANRGPFLVNERIKDLQALLKTAGERALEEMAAITTPGVDLRKEVEFARNAVSNKSPTEALRAFANIHPSISAKQLRDDAVDSLTNPSIRAMIPTVFTSHDGRVIAKHSGLAGSVPTEKDEAVIRAEMVRFHYEPLVNLVVWGRIMPALDVLTLEHRLRESDLIELARRSPIVPPGREVLFGKALYEGLDRDFVTSIHLLAPQIENLVRFHMNRAGEVTTHVDENGIVAEKGLSALVAMPEIVDVFWEDLIYEIETLFCDQIGANLRNNIAHGLLDDRQCQTVESVYAWWFMLKLILSPFWSRQRSDDVSGDPEQAGQEDSSDRTR